MNNNLCYFSVWFCLMSECVRRCCVYYGYVFEVSFYTAAPLSLCCTLMPEVFGFAADLVAEFIVKGKRQMPAFEFELWESVNPFLKLRWFQWIGAAIFLWGWMHQRCCHAILVSANILSFVPYFPVSSYRFGCS